MRLFFFPSQDASESSPEEATAPLITAAPMRFNASRRVILLSVLISLIHKCYCNLLSVAKIEDASKSGLTEITGHNTIFTVYAFVAPQEIRLKLHLFRFLHLSDTGVVKSRNHFL